MPGEELVEGSAIDRPGVRRGDRIQYQRADAIEALRQVGLGTGVIRDCDEVSHGCLQAVSLAYASDSYFPINPVRIQINTRIAARSSTKLIRNPATAPPCAASGSFW